MKKKRWWIIVLVLAAAIYFLPRYTRYRLPIGPARPSPAKSQQQMARLRARAAALQHYNNRGQYSSTVCFLVDMAMESGKKRFFVYDLTADTIITSGLMAHGSCNTSYLETARFSNKPDCGCSSLGRYAVGNKYQGRFGDAYKLHGLDSSNSHAFNRFIVLHAYDCVPDNESLQPICNSLGCPMVSYHFLGQLSKQVNRSRKPVLLWMFQ